MTPVDTYSIEIKGELGNGQSQSATFYLNIINSCTSASLTAPEPILPDLEYFIGKPILTYSPPRFTTDKSYCPILYTLTQFDLSAYPNNLISFDSSTLTVSVHSLDNSLIDLYFLILRGEI